MEKAVSATHDFGAVTARLERHVATLIIGGVGEENVMLTDTYKCLLEAVTWCASDPEVRIVVLTGAGANFSVGGDHSRHSERDVHDFRNHLAVLMNIATTMRTCGKPVIAAVRGRCTGGMNQVALLADLTIASETAKFGQYGMRSGSLPALWGLQLLPLTVGEKRAREIVYMCWEHDAAEALQMGLVNRVVPDAGLEAEVERWCDRLLEMSPRSLRFAKSSLNLGSDMRSSGVWQTRDALAEFAGTEEHKEAIASYIEQRPPSWYPPREHPGGTA